MTFYGRRKSEDHQPFKFPILCIVIITQSNALQTAFNNSQNKSIDKNKVFHCVILCPLNKKTDFLKLIGNGDQKTIL